MKILDVNHFNIRLIDLISVIQNCEIQIVKDLETYELVSNETINLRKSDVKTVFYYYILKHVCDIVIESRTINKCVYFYNKECLDKSDLIVFSRYAVDVDGFKGFVSTIIRKMNTILPNLFYMCNDSFCFDDLCNDIKTGESSDVLNNIKSQLDKKHNKNFTFENAKKFVKKFGLTYLDKQYFNKVKIKSLVYK